MKKIFIGLFCLLIITACKEDEILRYSESQDGIYFVKRNINESKERNFALSSIGDSLKTDTIALYLRVLGRKAKEDRKIFFETASFNKLDSSGFAYVEYPNPFLFRKNLYTDTMKVVIHRPTERQISYGVELKINSSHQESDFGAGALEALSMGFVIKDHFTKPASWSWSEKWYGEYSVEKHAFIITVLRKTNFIDDWEKGRQNIRLREALDSYNAENPDNPKPFTFPTYTWDW